MADPYIEIFNWPGGGEIASVVVDQKDFDLFCEDLRGIIVVNQSDTHVTDAQIESLKAAKHVPMIGRGEKTEFLFEKFGIEQEKMCIMVRGKGQELLDEIKKRDQAGLN